MNRRKTRVVVFPFDLFGSAGCAAGAELIADELREILADNRSETVPTRAQAYTSRVSLTEAAFVTPADYQDWRATGHQLAQEALKSEFTVWLTGNHLGALPVYEVLAQQQEPLPLIVQLDAHLDIHHFRDCEKAPTHGNFLLHLPGPLPPLVNVGHRDLLLPVEYIARYYRRTISVAEWARDSHQVLRLLQAELALARQVWLDLDCDVFEPAVFPALARPVPFGLMPLDILQLVEAIPSEKLAGLIVSEFDPGRDQNDRSLALVTWLLEHLLLRKYEGRLPSR
ncbi:MAG: arginase family protein [Gemmataceae bacterium]